MGIYEISMNSKTKTEKVKNSYWLQIKSNLADCSKGDLMNLILDLYDLSSSNKDFLEARFLKDRNALERYKEQIKKYVSPKDPWKESQRVSLKDAKKILSDYKKATGDKIGLADLMIHYVECGTTFSSMYGDMDEQYYASLESVFENALKIMKEFDAFEINDFIKRLKNILKMASGMGYGYYDTIAELFDDAYPAHEI